MSAGALPIARQPRSTPSSRVRPIHVCHVMSADLWAGAEVQVATVASYLVRHPDVTLTVVLMNDGRLARELRRLGVSTVVVDEQRHGALSILSFLHRFLRDHEIDVVHTHRYKDTVLGSVAARLADIPHLIRTVHGLSEPMHGWDRVKFRLYEALDKAALWWFADRIIAVSKGMAETLKQTGYKRTAVTHLHNGIDLGKVRPTWPRDEVRCELGAGTRTFLIGTAGRLSAVKAQSTLIRAAKLILQRQPHARFLIVGDGPLRRELQALAVELGVDRECIFTGAREDVFDLVRALDVFVLPSLAEGIPMALLEAMALERPVVATAVGGIPEVVKHRVNGLLVRAGDEYELANACVHLALDHRYARQLGRQGRRTVERHFSHETNGEALVDLYRTVEIRSSRGSRVRTNEFTGHSDAASLGPFTLAWELVRGLVRYVARVATAAADRARERRRMEQIRNHPAPLLAVLRSATRILIVCQGNIIRSPFAASLLTEALSRRGRVSISSAGLSAVDGNPAHETAVHVASARLVDLSGHRSSGLAPEAIATHDVIFVMDVPQLVALQNRFPEARGKTFLLACLASDAPLEISDPIDGDEPRFQACFGHISRAVQPIAQTLAAATMRQ